MKKTSSQYLSFFIKILCLYDLQEKYISSVEYGEMTLTTPFILYITEFVIISDKTRFLY